jgi:type IV pilus assembly protein PilA
MSMVTRMRKTLKDQRGLTLIELLAVVVILGIIAAIAVPAIGNIIEKQKLKAHQANAIMILDAAKLYWLDNPGETGVELNINKLMDSTNKKKYLDNAPIDPETNLAYTEVKVTYNSGNYLITLGSTKKYYDAKDRDYVVKNLPSGSSGSSGP